MLAICVARAAMPNGDCAMATPRLAARVTAVRPRLLHRTVPPRSVVLLTALRADGTDAQAKARRAAPSFLELLKFTVFAMPIYLSPTLLSLIDTAAVGQVSSTCKPRLLRIDIRIYACTSHPRLTRESQHITLQGGSRRGGRIRAGIVRAARGPRAGVRDLRRDLRPNGMHVGR